MNSLRGHAVHHRDSAQWLDGNMMNEDRLKDQWRMNTTSYEFLGTQFMALTLEQTIDWLVSRKDGTEFQYIVTPNVDHIVRMWRDPKTYKHLYDGATLSVCDSRILEVMARLSGIPLSPVPGSDVTAHLFKDYINAGEAVNIIGGDAQIYDSLKSRFGLSQLNQHIPPMGLKNKPEAIKACAEFIAANRARFTFICVGSPQQELVAQAAQNHPDCVGTGLCVGASLEFLTGRVKRAPLWVQKLRMEWLYRLASEPKRLWKRYLVEGPRVFYLWMRWSLGKRL